ncbi:MAG: nuclear transport factor 2 family protein [Nocardioidaceae bacterium]
MTDDDRGAAGRLTARRMELIRDYFRKVDAGDSTLLDLYTDDVEVYFPKFGFGRGKSAMRDFAERLGADLAYLAHDIDGLRFHPAGDVIVVEGTEWGRTTDGTDWPDGEVSTGSFCNVFTFDGELISSVRIYTDPDFTSAHSSRVAALHHSGATQESR